MRHSDRRSKYRHGRVSFLMYTDMSILIATCKMAKCSGRGDGYFRILIIVIRLEGTPIQGPHVCHSGRMLHAAADHVMYAAFIHVLGTSMFLLGSSSILNHHSPFSSLLPSPLPRLPPIPQHTRTRYAARTLCFITMVIKLAFKVINVKGKIPPHPSWILVRLPLNIVIMHT